MASKFELDEKDLQLNLQPKDFSLHLVEELEKWHPKNEAQVENVLASLIQTLTHLNSEGHPYGAFFNRMLNINHPDPIDKVLCTFIIKINQNFIRLSENWERRKQLLKQKKQKDLEA